MAKATAKKKSDTQKQKLYVVYMFSEEDSDERMFIGIFDSKERVEREKQEIARDLDCNLTDDDFEVIEAKLNHNFSTGKTTKH